MGANTAQLLSMLCDGNSQDRHVERMLLKSPDTCGRLLAMANSPAFGRSREIGTIGQAMRLMGRRRIIAMLTADSLSSVVPDPLPGYDESASNFLAHSTGAAMLCEQIALARVGTVNPQAVTAALLHDIGKLVIGTYLAERGEALLMALGHDGRPMIEIERQLLGTDHAIVGAQLAEFWGLPAPIVDGVRWHHEPDNVPEGVDQEMVDLVHVSSGLAHMLGFGIDVAGLQRNVEPEAVKRLGITPEIADQVASRALTPAEELTRAMDHGTS